MSSLAPPKCPQCCRNFSFSQAGLQPRILSCRHSFCKQCLVQTVRTQKDEIICPKCKAPTIVPKGDVGLKCLPLNIFLVGLACTATKQQINPFHHKLEFKAKPKNDKSSAEAKELQGGRPLCTTCKQGPADCFCQQCKVSMCDSCFTVIHRNQGEKAHARVSLVTDSVYGCPDHKNMAREFFCQDDKVPICAKCGLTGAHKGHNIMHIQEKNSEIYKELQPAFDLAKGTLKKLYYTSELVRKEEKKIGTQRERVRAEIHERFLEFFADLQLSLHSLEEMCYNATAVQMENIAHIKINLASNICRLVTVMEDVKPGLTDKGKVPATLAEMVSILNGASSLPWHLSGPSKDEPIVTFDPGEVKVLSSVNVHADRSHSLKCSDELSEDFEEPEIEDDILKQCHLFAAKVDRKKKKKEIGPDHVRILQREGLLPKDLSEIKPKPVSKPRIDLKKINKKQFVRVVHIRSPACFYVHRQSELPKLEKMMKSLSNICESIEDLSKHIPDPIQVGTKCCCKFDDNQWYRAMVKTVPEDVADVIVAARPEDLLADDQEELKVEVVYIDYGNFKWVAVSK